SLQHAAANDCACSAGGRWPIALCGRTYSVSVVDIARREGIAEVSVPGLHGALAWWLWGLVHILFLLGLRNRVVVAVSWLWSYVTYRSATRLITGSSDGVGKIDA